MSNDVQIHEPPKKKSPWYLILWFSLVMIFGLIFLASITTIAVTEAYRAVVRDAA